MRHLNQCFKPTSDTFLMQMIVKCRCLYRNGLLSNSLRSHHLRQPLANGVSRHLSVALIELGHDRNVAYSQTLDPMHTELSINDSHQIRC